MKYEFSCDDTTLSSYLNTKVEYLDRRLPGNCQCCRFSLFFTYWCFYKPVYSWKQHSFVCVCVCQSNIVSKISLTSNLKLLFAYCKPTTIASYERRNIIEYCIFHTKLLWYSYVVAACRHSIVQNAHAFLDVVGRRFDSSVRPLMLLWS